MSTHNLARIQKAEYKYRKLASSSNLQQDRCQSHLIVVVHHHQVPQAQSPEQLEHSRKRCLLQGNQLPLAHFTPPWEEIQTPKPSISRVLSCSFPSMPNSKALCDASGVLCRSLPPKAQLFFRLCLIHSDQMAHLRTQALLAPSLKASSAWQQLPHKIPEAPYYLFKVYKASNHTPVLLPTPLGQ